MFQTIMSAIRSGEFKLEKILDRIRFYHARGDLSAEEMGQLMDAARSQAVESMGVDARTEILELWKAVHALQQSVADLAAMITPPEDDSGDEPGEDPGEQIPDFVQPTGAHDAYNTGDKVRYKGEIWECVMDNCVWDPDSYPAGWRKVEA